MPGIHPMTPAVVRVCRTAVPVAAGQFARRSASVRFVAYLDRRSRESLLFKLKAPVAPLKTRHPLGALATSRVCLVSDQRLTNCLSFRKHLSWPSASSSSRIIKERAEFRGRRTVLGHTLGRIYNFRVGLTADWSRALGLSAQVRQSGRNRLLSRSAGFEHRSANDRRKGRLPYFRSALTRTALRSLDLRT